MFEDVIYETAAQLDVEELMEFYDRHSRPPTPSLDKLSRMVERTLCFVTARKGGRLVGFARGLTDGVRGRVAECKLDPSLQGPACVTKLDGRIEHDSGGIATELARRVIAALWEDGVERIDVVCHDTEVDFCEELGFRRTGAMAVLSMASRRPAAEPRATTAAAT